MEMGVRLPAAFASILRMRDAALRSQDKSLVLASARQVLKFTDVAPTLREVFGSFRCAARQDILVTKDAYGPLGGDKEQETCETHKKANRQGVCRERKEGLSNASTYKVKGDGPTLKGFNRHTGVRNRRHMCDSEYHLVPNFPWQGAPKSDFASASPGRGKARKPSYSAILMETPVSVKKADLSESVEANSAHEQSFAATPGVGGSFLVSESDSRCVTSPGSSWIRAPRPIFCVFVGSSAATAFCSGEDTNGLQHSQPLRDSALEAVALGKCVAQRTVLWASREAGVTSLFSR